MASKAEWAKLAGEFHKATNVNFAKTLAWMSGGIFCIFKAVARSWDGGTNIALEKVCEQTGIEVEDEDINTENE